MRRLEAVIGRYKDTIETLEADNEVLSSEFERSVAREMALQATVEELERTVVHIDDEVLPELLCDILLCF